MAGPNTLILIPGLLCTADLFAPQIAALAGRIDIEVADHTRFDNLPSIAAEILSKAPPRFSLAGLSLGGYIAFEVLRQAPDRVERLALLDTNARADRPEQAQQRRALVDAARAGGLETAAETLMPLLIHQNRLTDGPLVATIRKMAADTGVDAFARQQEAIITRPDNRPFLATIKCPTVIVVGAEDALTPVKVAQEMHAGIPGSHLEVVPDCGHLATLERPETVNRILSGWLDG